VTQETRDTSLWTLERLTGTTFFVSFKISDPITVYRSSFGTPMPLRSGKGGGSGRVKCGSFSSRIISVIAASSCTSVPASSATGSSGTSMSESTPQPSTIHRPSAVYVPAFGTCRWEPSIGPGLPGSPTAPPQVRVPISGPNPAGGGLFAGNFLGARRRNADGVTAFRVGAPVDRISPRAGH
jgi:hypothetical protein